MRVMVWGRRPPPVGGVVRSAAGLHRSLRASGYEAELIDFRQAREVLRAVATAQRGRTLHIFNISSPGRAPALALLQMVLRGTKILMIHAGPARQDLAPARPGARTLLLRLAMSRFDQIWTANADIASNGGSHFDAHAVSPFSAAGRPGPSGSRSERALVFCYASDPLYGVDVALDAMRRVRSEKGPSMSLCVVLYGPDEDGGRYAMMARLQSEDWVEIVQDLDPQDVDDLLGTSTLLLRPSTHDGDALVVREALARGCRVIASDNVPRPEGVELARRDARSFAEAIVRGGPLSDGSGLGAPIDDVTLAFLEGLGSR